MNWGSWDNRLKHMLREFLKAVAYSNSFASLVHLKFPVCIHDLIDARQSWTNIKTFNIKREPQTKSVRICQIKILQPTHFLLEKRLPMKSWWPKKLPYIWIKSLDSVVLIVRGALPWPPNKVFTNHPPIGVWEFDSQSRLLTKFKWL